MRSRTYRAPGRDGDWRNAATVIMGGLLIVLGYWAYNGVRDSIAETRVTSLEALLGTVVKGLDVWVGEHPPKPPAWPRTRRWSSARCGSRPSTKRQGAAPGRARPRPRTSARDLSRRCRLRAWSPSASSSAPASCLRRRIRALRAAPALRCVPAAARSRAGRRPAIRAALSRDGAFRQGAVGSARPVAWFLAPIRGRQGPAVAALAMGVEADSELATIFSAARPGTTAEAYAFSDDGLMLTPSRFAEELIAAGVLPEAAAASSAFLIMVRDPGGNLLAGHTPALEPAARPLTQAGALAVAARGKTSKAISAASIAGSISQLSRQRRDRRLALAAGLRHGRHRGNFDGRSVPGAAVLLDQLRRDRRLRRAVAGRRADVGDALSRLQRQFGRLQRLGAYTLERKISEGGMATIYLARHALLKRPTAIKILKKQVATDEFIHRFEREVQLASQLLHPNTVEVYDFGRTREGQPYYVMEYLDGLTLAELVEHSGPVPPGRAIHILRQVGAALREAHLHGMIHRDVKPENVMLCHRGEDDVVKLLDFGLVKNLEQAQTRDITKQLKILGTPRYMAPERILNPADVDARSDIYAVGAVGYFLLTGKPIFEGDNNLEITNQIMHAPAPRAAASGVGGIPEALDALIAACLEKDRSRRPQTADAVIDALDRLSSRLAWTQVDADAWWERLSDATGPVEGISGLIRFAAALRGAYRFTPAAAASPPSNRARRTTRTTPRCSDACPATRGKTKR